MYLHIYCTVGAAREINHRSSRPEVFCKEGVDKNFAKFTGKHLCQTQVFDEVARFRSIVPQK